MIKKTNKKFIYSILTFILLLIFWEIVIGLGLVSSFFLPKPSYVLVVIIKNFNNFFLALLITLRHIIISYIIGSFLGILIGLLIGWHEKLERFLGSLLNIIFAVPAITFLPLFIIWFGIGEITIIILASLNIFFIMYINTFSGVKKIDKGYIEVFKNLKGKKSQILQKIIFPASLPYIAAGLRYGIGKVLSVVIITEMLLGTGGLGKLLWDATTLFRPELVIAIQIFAGISAIMLFYLFDKLEKKIFPWMEEIQS